MEGVLRSPDKKPFKATERKRLDDIPQTVKIPAGLTGYTFGTIVLAVIFKINPLEQKKGVLLAEIFMFWRVCSPLGTPKGTPPRYEHTLQNMNNSARTHHFFCSNGCNFEYTARTIIFQTQKGLSSAHRQFYDTLASSERHVSAVIANYNQKLSVSYTSSWPTQVDTSYI